MKTKHWTVYLPGILGLSILIVGLNSCEKDKSIPALKTSTVAEITSSSAIGGGTISSDGGASVTARGVCWGTSQHPTTSDQITSDGTGTGSFTSDITGLSPNTTYYMRAYATNSIGTAYGNEIFFVTTREVITMTDIEGNSYRIVTIGNQDWMGENLKTTHYNDGTSIPLVTEDNDWKNLNTPGYCWFANDQASFGATYGSLYNGYTVMTNKLCPVGWHVPSDDEMKTLEMQLGMSQADADESGWRGDNLGSKLAGNNNCWYDGVLKSASDFGTSGFEALAGGYRFANGYFDPPADAIKVTGYWWTSTESEDGFAWIRQIVNEKTTVMRFSIEEKYGCSVRCLKD
jgi:uncharacterized protein (TIGR02145 family)